MKTMMVAVGVLALLCAGCGDDGKTDPNGEQPTQPEGPQPETKPAAPKPPTTPPAPAVPASVSFKGLTAYDGLQGQQTIEHKIEIKSGEALDRIELLANGEVVASADAAPYALSFDSTKVADGVVKLALRSHAGDQSADSDELPVIVFNQGEAATWTDGSAGQMEILAGLDSHVKHHWIMSAEVKRVLGVISWDNAEFKLDIAVGVGGCPHSGEEAARADSATSPALVEYVAEGKLNETQWFAHSGATNEADLVGKKSGYSIKVYLLK